jgi:hypothetical protein
MKKSRALIPVLAVATVVAVAVVVYLTMNPVGTTLEFVVRDAVSKNWVWNATFSLQDRVIRSHFQSDGGPLTQRFTNLKPGKAIMEVSAPSYVSQSIPVTLKRGANRLEAAIDLVGYEIRDLTRWVIVEHRVSSDIVQEIRPVSSEGPAVFNHPCMDIRILARISVQIHNGMPARKETKEGSKRGEELFKGVLEWRWDGLPETLFRYSSMIPGSQIKANSDPYWVIDYLIIVPDPRKTDRREIDQIMQKTLELPPERIEAFLEPYKNEGKLTPYEFTSWNVEGASS